MEFRVDIDDGEMIEHLEKRGYIVLDKENKTNIDFAASMMVENMETLGVPIYLVKGVEDYLLGKMSVAELLNAS